MKYLEKIYFYELGFEATRSSGPGGQHVNRTNSAVILRWNVLSTQSFHEEQKAYLIRALSAQLTNEGDLLIRSEQQRSQEANRQKCLEKLENILQKAFYIPKKRKKTRPTRSSIEKRHEGKKIRSHTKKMRQKVNLD